MRMFNVDRQTAQEISKLIRREELIDDDFARGDGVGAGDFLQFLPPSYGSDTSSIYNPGCSSSSSSRNGGKEFLKRVMPWPFLFVWPLCVVPLYKYKWKEMNTLITLCVKGTKFPISIDWPRMNCPSCRPATRRNVQPLLFPLLRITVSRVLTIHHHLPCRCTAVLVAAIEQSPVAANLSHHPKR